MVRLRRVSACESVVEHIKEQIINGKLKPGDRLPSEQRLSELLGVSRGTLREAIKKLQLMGVVAVRQGEGTFVTKVSPGEMMRTLSPMLLMDHTSILELIEARKIIEAETAYLCCLRASPVEIEEIEANLQAMIECSSLEHFDELDIEFHMRLAKAAKNRVLFRILETLRDLLFAQIREVLKDPEGAARACKYHRLIFSALEGRDPELARRHMLAHLKNVEDTLVQMLLHDSSDEPERPLQGGSAHV
ncbi:MAG: FadR/GntR family transcriptional regulator [Limnochordia bacterium]|jgi:GntR family transcriptional repressor for pyruvate dehydrogenase complex|nr:FadR family transcriptional regulator [Bacillota bacterium]